jgi:hypothetical protein
MLKQAGIGLISASLLLAGCGGGIGGGTASLDYHGATTDVAITTTAEADAIAGFAASQATSGDLSDATAAIPIGVSIAITGSNDQSARLHILSELAKRYADIALNTAPSSTNLLAGITYAPESCTGGGTTTLSVTVTDPDVHTVGDTFSIAFSNCIEGSEKTNGTVTLVLQGFTDQTLAAFSASFAFDNLKATNTLSGDYAWINGGFTAGFSGNGSTTPFVATLSGTSLVVEEQTGGEIEQHRLTSFSFVDTLSIDSYLSFDHDFTIASTRIGGTITVATVTPFIIDYNGSSYDDYPSSGQLLITGANNAKVRLTVLDSTQVYVQYDIVPIDGVYEADATVLWSAL